jgi:hypothetical protein
LFADPLACFRFVVTVTTSKASRTESEPAVLIFFRSGFIGKQSGQDVGHFHRIGIFQRENLQLGNIGDTDIDLFNQLFDGGNELFRGADHQGIGAFVRHGDHAGSGAPGFAVARTLVVIVIAASSAEAAETPIVPVVLAFGGFEEGLDGGGQGGGIGVTQRKNAYRRDAGDGSVQGFDDLHNSPDIGLGIGQDQRITAFIRRERGIRRKQRLQVFGHLGGVGVANRNNLSDHLVGFGNVIRVIAGPDGNIPLSGLIPVDDPQGAPVAQSGVTVLIQHRVQEGQGFFRSQRLVAPDIHGSFHFGFQHDDESHRFAEIIQHRFQRHTAKVQAEIAFRFRRGR